MNNYSANVLGAIDLIVQERMKDLKFDKTIVCTIVENKGDSIYVVDDGTTTFEAVGDLMSYPVGFQVNVLIPQGDYSQQKTITGRYIANTGEINSVRYMTPFDNCLNITDNIIPKQETYSLLANGEKTEILVWEETFQDSYKGFTRVGLAADFLAALSEFNPILGSYGLRVELDGTAKENMRINNVLYLDSSDMYGNPYLFETYFRQEKIFDISSFKEIKGIKIYYYQDSKFQREIDTVDGVVLEKIPSTYKQFTEEKKLANNLKVKDFELFFGYDISQFEKDTVLLFTGGEQTYNKHIETEKEKAIRTLETRWIRNDGKNTYVFNINDITPSIRIHWYKKDIEETDFIAGDGWVEISEEDFAKDQLTVEMLTNEKEHEYKVIITEGEFDETFSIEEEAVVCKKYESNILKFTSAVKLSDKTTLNIVNGLKLKFVNDAYNGNYRIYNENKTIKNTSEASKVRGIMPILTLDDKEVELTKDDIVYWSIPSVATMIIPISQKYNGSTTICTIKKVYEKSNQYDIYDGQKTYLASSNVEIKFKVGDEVYVEFNESETQNKILGKHEGNYEIHQSGPTAIFEYKLNKLYSETKINNVITCTVVHDNEKYTASQTLVFGATGTAGTDYTFAIEPVGEGVYTKYSGEKIVLAAKLYDYNDELIEWNQEKIKWEWATPNAVKTFRGIEINENKYIEGAILELTPDDVTYNDDGSFTKKEDFNIDQYRYNLVKATVTVGDVVFEETTNKKPLVDDNGNYLAAPNSATILNQDENGVIIDPDIWASDTNNYEKIKWKEETATQKPRKVTMTAYYAIPVRDKDKYFIEGPTSITYDSAGSNPIFENSEYKIYGVDELKNIGGEDIVPIKWEIETLVDKKYQDQIPFLPQIKMTGTTGYKLAPKAMYVSGLVPEICIKCYREVVINGTSSEEVLWVQPLIIRQEQWGSTLLNQWDGSLTIDEKNGTILSTMIGAGIKNPDNTFSGVLMGDVRDDAGSKIGLYGFDHGQQSYGFRVDGTAFIGKSGTGRINFDGNKGIIESGNFIEERGDIDGAGTHINLKDGFITGYGLEIIAKGNKANSSDWDYEKVLVDKQVFATDNKGNYLYKDQSPPYGEDYKVNMYLAGSGAYVYKDKDGKIIDDFKIADDQSYKYRYTFEKDKIVEANENYIKTILNLPVLQATLIENEKDKDGKEVPPYYKVETEYFSLNHIIEIENDGFYALATNPSDSSASQSFTLENEDGKRYTINNFGKIYKAEKYDVQIVTQKVEEWQYVLKEGVEKWKRPIITLSTKNQDKIFSVELQDYDNNTGKYGEIKPLIHISDDLAYIQSEGFKNDNTSFLKGTGIQMVFSTNKEDKDEYPLGVQISGMWMAMNKGSNRLSINSNSSSFPFEIGRVENGQIHNGLRIGWNGLCEWGAFGSPSVSISSGGISTNSLSVGGSSIDSYIRTIVEGYGYATKSEIPDVSDFVTNSNLSIRLNSYVPYTTFDHHWHYITDYGITSGPA